MNNNCLEHHGILGMKWGVRRFQRKDGSLTSLGKKRNSESDDPYSNNQTNKKNDSSSSSKKKSISELTDDELFARNRRRQLEVDDLRLQKQYDELYRELNPKRVSKGKQFVDTAINKAIIPAATNAGKNLLEGYLNKVGREKLGLKTGDYVDNLAKEVKKLNLEKQYKNLKEEADQAKKSSKKRTSNETKSEPKSDTESDSFTNNRKKEENETWTGTVEGKGTSHFKWSKQGEKYYQDADFRDVKMTDNRNTDAIQIGQRCVTGLLEDKHRR